jgi:hypothetical protein
MNQLLKASKRVIAAEDAVAGMDETEMSSQQWQERELAWGEFREAVRKAKRKHDGQDT